MRLIDWLTSPIDWLTGLFGSNSDGSDEQDADGGPDVDLDQDVDWSKHSLYELGELLCTYYPEGIPSFQSDNATQWDDYTISVVLHDTYNDVSTITPAMIADLDRLRAESVAESDQLRHEMHTDGRRYLRENAVIQFRRTFFDCFDTRAVETSLQRVYHDAREDFQLERIVREETTDHSVFEYRVPSLDDRSAQITPETVPDGDPIERQSVGFTTESASMHTLSCRLDLGESQIGDTIEEMVEAEARLLWDTLDVESGRSTDVVGSDTAFGDDQDPVYPVLDAMQTIRNANGAPDTIVTDAASQAQYGRRIHDCSVHTDATGVMDVPFVVADSDNTGYRVTRTPLSITYPREIEQPYVYQLTWQGNYVVTDPDMVSGPV